ncbi:MAG: PKD domain-containing protein [Bacteroidia bacterium]|nr:PKD domain-containing protein [Bacteroidia bacterium]MCF8448201.1 PKD domain-containing protein [Bacteroidia bacterium]
MKTIQTISSKGKTNYLSKLLVALTAILLLAGNKANAQYLFQTSTSTDLTSVNSGNQFIYIFNYSTAGNTTSGQNVVAEISLPLNLVPYDESNFSNSISYPTSQVTGASYNSGTKKVTITYINPLPAGATGQIQIKFKYINGTTPNGYAPDLFTKVTFSNPLSVSPVYSDTLNVTALAANNFTIGKVKNSGGAINDLTIYKFTIGSTASSNGALTLSNPVLRDTLPTGVEFVEATAFSGSNTPTYDPFTRIVTWTWTSGLFNTNYSGTAYLSVRHLSPTYSIGSTACNSATIHGVIPVLPIGNTASSSKRGSVCFGIAAPSPAAICNGGSISAATASWLSKHVLSGTTDNSFSNGWSNTGNTELDSVVLVYTIDKSVDVTTIKIGALIDGLARTSKDTVIVRYKTNLSPATYIYKGTYFVSGSVNITPTLAPGEYLTEVKFSIYGHLPIGGSQDFTYKGNVRSTALNAKDGSPIIEGTTYNTSNPGDDGTLIYNNSFGTYYYNGAAVNYSNCSGLAEIMIPQPVFNTPSKSTTNGSSFRASDTTNYRFSIQLGGNVDAADVVIVDTLDSRLTYINGSSSITIGSNTFTPTVNGQILTWNLGTVPDGGSTYTINFKAVIAPGTPAASIPNKIYISSSNALMPKGTTATKNTTIITAVALVAYKGQNGCDTNFVYYPINATTQEGGLINYKITVKNQGNVASKDMVLIDVFPFIGDQRGSQWFANLVGAVTLADPYSTIYYNAVANPCYSDFVPAVNPPACSAPVWTLTPPSDITSVKSIKIVRTQPLAALDSIEFSWPMRVPVGTPSNIIMNNTIYYQVSRADMAGTTGRLLPAAPNQVGMVTSCAPVLGSLGNYVWIDINKNGIQDEPASYGLNGIKVYLYGAGLDNAIGGGDDILLDSTFTGNNFSGNPGYYKFIELVSGKYFVKFQTEYNQYSITPVTDQIPQMDGGNDAIPSTGLSGLVTIDASGSGLDKDDPTIDAGYFPIGSLGNYVWNDANGNGLQDEPAAKGMNGVTVYLYKQVASVYVVVDTTVTANDLGGNPGYYNFIIETSGNYKVLFPIASLTTQTTGAGVDGNSDANTSTGFSPVVVMNLISSGLAVNNPTIDAGYICSKPNAGIDQIKCMNDTVSLTATGVGSGIWTAHVANPATTTFTAATSLNTDVTGITVAGTYQFIYTVSGSCADTVSVLVKATSSSNSVAYICAGGSYLFNGHTFNATGNYTVHITNVEGCDSAAHLALTVVDIPSSATTVNDAAQCVNSNTFEFTLDHPQASVYYIFNYGDGHADTAYQNTFTHTYADSGNYVVSIHAMDTLAGCNTSFSLNTTVYPRPNISLWQNDTSRCIGGNVFSFRNFSTVPNGSISSTTWYYGDGNFNTVSGLNPVTYSYASPGTYYVVAEVSTNHNCVAFDSVRVVVAEGPVAGFGLIQNGCCGDITVSNTSTNATTFEWEFTAVNSSDVFKCTYSTNTFNIQLNPGSYHVRLIAKGTGGCVDTLTSLFDVLSKPNAIFETNVNSCGTNATFTNLSFAASAYSWNFGDPTSGAANTSTVENPSHLFTNPGTYTVTLIVENASGCSDTMVQNVVVNPSLGVSPIASFTYANLAGSCVNKVAFTNTSSNGSSYKWIFADGTINTNQNANKAFTVAGSYLVKLAVTSSTGCTDTATQTIVIASTYEGPTASFTVSNSSQCLAGNTFDFINTSTYNGGGWITSYSWDFGDGTFDNANTFAYNKTYATAGTYLVRLIANGSNSCKDTAYQIVTVKASPVLDFTTGSTCGKTVSFTNNSSNISGSYWNMGDGGVPCFDSTNFSHHYNDIGWYFVQLVGVAPNGCMDTLTKGIQVNNTSLPVASFTFDTVSCANAMRFTNTSGGGGVYTWNFGDGSNIDSTGTPVHSYTSAGVYNVSLTANVGENCTATTTVSVPAPQGFGNLVPEAKFGYGIEACTNTITASATSTNVTLQKWLYDGVVVGWGPNVTISAPTVGGHSLEYVVANGGCYDTLNHTIMIQAAPIAGFDLTASGCSNSVSVSSNSINANTYNWNFGDPSTLADSAFGSFASYTYGANGTFSISLIVQNNAGCADTISQDVTVTRAFNPHVANFTFDNSICNCRCNNTVKFTNLTYGSGKTFLWSFGDGTTSVQANPSKGYAKAGTYQITLTSIDSTGCMSTLTKLITVVEDLSGPSASFNTDYQVQCLSSNSFNFYNTSAYNGNGWVKKYYWNFGDGTIDTNNTFVFNKVYTTAGNYVVTLVAEAANGCKDTMTMYIQVRSLPCTGSMKYVNLQDGTNWQIGPDYGNGIANSLNEIQSNNEFNLYPNPNNGAFTLSFIELVKGDYTVVVTDMYGREIMRQEESHMNSQSLQIEASQLAEGTYFVSLMGENQSYTAKKFTVIK